MSSLIFSKPSTLALRNSIGVFDNETFIHRGYVFKIFEIQKLMLFLELKTSVNRNNMMFSISRCLDKMCRRGSHENNEKALGALVLPVAIVSVIRSKYFCVLLGFSFRVHHGPNYNCEAYSFIFPFKWMPSVHFPSQGNNFFFLFYS